VRAPLRVAAALLAVLAASAAPARAQDGGGAGEGARFLPRYDFHLTAEHLSNDDPRLIWEANYGGALDFVDYGSGRVRFIANYRVLLGDEIRAFDPNQGEYLLEATVSRRVRGVELAGVLHHISRHLSDRAKFDPIDWNMAGVRVEAAETRGRLALETRVDVLGVMQQSWVDYDWELDMATGVRYAAAPRVGVFSAGSVRLVGVDGTRDRSTQGGFRVEGGVSLEGEAAAVELFAAVERRVDPIPFETSTATWFALGFRLVGR